MILFKNKNQKDLTDLDFREALTSFPLYGKSVMVYSRLFSFGRLSGADAAVRMIEILLEAVGPEGTLCIPCYTFSGYKNETFDIKSSKCTVGLLGEVARDVKGAVRTIHPIYSNVCIGKDAEKLQEQDYTSCFGNKSFFSLFSQLNNGYFLALGTNFSAITSAHYYDQKYQSPLRLVKKFKALIRHNGELKEILFDSYVKKLELHDDKTNCYAKFDALANELSISKSAVFGNEWVHGINEDDYHFLYKSCLETDPFYFILAPRSEFIEYYQKNKFKLYYGKVDSQKAYVAKGKFTGFKNRAI